MPITVQCECGKRSTVGDPLAGKTIRCPGCGQELYVPAAPTPAGGKGKTGKPARSAPAIHVSSGTITWVSILGVLGLLIILFLAGPMRVWHNWEALGSKPNDDVSDVISFAMKAYLSEHGMLSRRPGQQPSVDDVTFIRPFLTMSMPDTVPFRGRSSQGKFEGNYNVKNGEINAKIEYGGMTVAGLVDMVKAKNSFTITGREGPDKQPSAECNGQKLQIIWPKFDESE